MSHADCRYKVTVISPDILTHNRLAPDMVNWVKDRFKYHDYCYVVNSGYNHTIIIDWYFTREEDRALFTMTWL